MLCVSGALHRADADAPRRRHPTPSLPTGWFDWIRPFFAISDNYILNNCSLDAFFFLRFLRVLSVICLVGGIIAWPILLPIHGTGGNNLFQLEELTIGNIKVPLRYFAHVAVAWVFFGALPCLLPDTMIDRVRRLRALHDMP